MTIPPSLPFFFSVQPFFVLLEPPVPVVSVCFSSFPHRKTVLEVCCEHAGRPAHIDRARVSSPAIQTRL